MTYSEKIDRDYLERLRKLDLPAKPKSEWVVLHMHGDGIIASPAWNFQVYTGKRGLTLVTNDHLTLQRVLRGERIDEEGKRIISIDDSGWGFPLGGVLCGAYDFQTNRFYRKEVEVEYFQGVKFSPLKAYLERYVDRAMEIVDEIAPSPLDTLVKMCTGYVNLKAKETLREEFLVVEVDRIGEPLQSWLETEHRRYIHELLGEDVYYDPRVLTKNEIVRRYNEVRRLIRERNLMHLAKTGWESFSRSR